MLALFACFDVCNLLIFLRVFCLCRIPKKVAKDNDENVDYGPYDKDDSEEEEAGQNITPKPVKKTTTKTKNSQKVVEMDRIEELRAKVFSGSISPEEMKEFAELTKTKEPTARAKYDHETTMNNLIDDTKETVEHMEKLKDDYEAVVYMWSLCNYWKSEHKIDADENRAKKKAHNAFLKHFKKHQHLHGLPPATPSTAGSKTSSRAASVALEEMEEVEEEEEEEEEVEETK